MYGKVFASLWEGSLIGHTDAQLVFVYLIAHSDSSGHVEEHPLKIATLTGMSEDRVEAAIAILESGDPASRSKELDGARIERVSDGYAWMIVNYVHYRGMRNTNERREQNRQAAARHRLRKSSAGVSQGKPQSSQGEGEGEGEVEVKNTRSKSEPEGFTEWYQNYPRHVARRAASRAYASALKRATAEQLTDGVRRYRASLNGTPPDKIKHPATWLNGDCWLDESGVDAQEETLVARVIRRLEAE